MRVVMPRGESSWMRESVAGLARALASRPEHGAPAVDAESAALAATAVRALLDERPGGRAGVVAGGLGDEVARRLGLPLHAAREVAGWSQGALAVEGSTAIEVRAVAHDPAEGEERARVRLTLHTVTGHALPAAPVVTREIEVMLARRRGYRRWRARGRRCLMVL